MPEQRSRSSILRKPVTNRVAMKDSKGLSPGTKEVSRDRRCHPLKQQLALPKGNIGT